MVVEFVFVLLYKFVVGIFIFLGFVMKKWRIVCCLVVWWDKFLVCLLSFFLFVFVWICLIIFLLVFCVILYVILMLFFWICFWISFSVLWLGIFEYRRVFVLENSCFICGGSLVLYVIFSFFLYFVFNVVGSIVWSVVILKDSVLLDSYDDRFISFFVKIGVRFNKFFIFLIDFFERLDVFFIVVINFWILWGLNGIMICMFVLIMFLRWFGIL